MSKLTELQIYRRKRYKKNKVRIDIQVRNWKRKNKIKMQKYQCEYFQRNKKHICDLRRKWLINNRSKLYEYQRNCRDRNLKSWENFIPSIIRCQVCRRRIFFNKKNSKDAVHFDHRNNKSVELIKRPYNWLKHHRRNTVNQQIWVNCDFGMLCRECNRALPMKERIKFVRNIVRYVIGE